MIAIMVSVTILAGAVAQFPAGRLSDRMDRRYVLAGLAGLGAVAGVGLSLFQPANVYMILILVSLYGAAANALYPIAVAHANDHASSEDFVKISGGLLLLYGVGTIIGPTLGGPVMTWLGPHALFAVTALSHILVTVYAIFRSRIRAPVPVEERDSYAGSPALAPSLTTPESLLLNPRAAEGGSDQDQERTAS
jgi:MFS family permease